MFSRALIIILFIINWQSIVKAETCEQSNTKALLLCAQRSAVQTCEQVKASKQCQDVYKEIEMSGHSRQSFERNCAEADKIRDLDYELIKACSIGAFEKTFGDFGKALGEFAAEATIQAEKSVELEKECNSSLENKKKIFLTANIGLPKALQAPVPSDQYIQNRSCQEIYQIDIIQKGNHRYQQTMQEAQLQKAKKQSLSPEQAELLEWKANQEKDPTKTEKDHKSLASLPGRLYDSAREGLEKAGVKMECYNYNKKMELFCGWLAEWGVGGSALYKTGKAVKRAMGFSKEAETVELSIKGQPVKQGFTHSSKLNFPNISPQTAEHIQSGHVIKDEAIHSLDKMTSEFNADFKSKKKISAQYLGQHASKGVGRAPQDPSLAIFRDGRRSTLFPKGITPEEVIKEAQGARLNFTPVKDSITEEEAIFKYKNAEYRVVRCNAENCKADGQIIKKGEVATLHPVCGEGVVQTVSLGTVRKLIDEASPDQKLTCPQYFKHAPCGVLEKDFQKIRFNDWPCH